MFGESATLTAQVTSVATGTVSFSIGTHPLGTATIDGTGTAVLSAQFSEIPVGSYVVMATYSGDSNFDGCNTSIVVAVYQASSNVTLSAGPNPSSYGDLVTFTAIILSKATGTVTFRDGTTVLGTGVVHGGTAIFATDVLSAGNHAITAIYGGDENFAGSTSLTTMQVINKATAQISLTSSANPPIYAGAWCFVPRLLPAQRAQ
jgi:hypothetical protein